LVWRVFWREDDVYLTEREFGGVAKLSLHRSGICRYALTTERCRRMEAENVAGNAKRLKTRWQRRPTPSTGIAHAATIWVPTMVLTPHGEIPDKGIHWLRPTPPGMANRIDLLYTKDDRTTLDRRLPKGARLFATAPLVSGETLMFVDRHFEFDEVDFLAKFGQMAIKPEYYSQESADAFETGAIEGLEGRGKLHIGPNETGVFDIVDIGLISVSRELQKADSGAPKARG